MLKRNEIEDPAKRFLIRARTINQELTLQRMEVERYRDKGTTVIYTAQEHGKNTGARPNGIETARVTAADITARIEERYRELERTRFEIDAVIRKVQDGRLRILLNYRYVQCGSWKEVADVIGYSEDHVKGNLHRIALDEVRKILITQNNTF